MVIAADLGKPPFPFAFICQWICVRAPKFFHHLALWDERAFRFRILVRSIEFAEGELRASHQGELAEFVVQLVRRFV